jgi:hypothetical protein
MVAGLLNHFEVPTLMDWRRKLYLLLMLRRLSIAATRLGPVSSAGRASSCAGRCETLWTKNLVTLVSIFRRFKDQLALEPEGLSAAAMEIVNDDGNFTIQ